MSEENEEFPFDKLYQEVFGPDGNPIDKKQAVISLKGATWTSEMIFLAIEFMLSSARNSLRISDDLVPFFVLYDETGKMSVLSYRFSNANSERDMGKLISLAAQAHDAIAVASLLQADEHGRTFEAEPRHKNVLLSTLTARTETGYQTWGGIYKILRDEANQAYDTEELAFSKVPENVVEEGQDGLYRLGPRPTKKERKTARAKLTHALKRMNRGQSAFIH
jgi:hypothetical protein